MHQTLKNITWILSFTWFDFYAQYNAWNLNKNFHLIQDVLYTYFYRKQFESLNWLSDDVLTGYLQLKCRMSHSKSQNMSTRLMHSLLRRSTSLKFFLNLTIGRENLEQEIIRIRKIPTIRESLTIEIFGFREDFKDLRIQKHKPILSNL